MNMCRYEKTAIVSLQGLRGKVQVQKCVGRGCIGVLPGVFPRPEREECPQN